MLVAFVGRAQFNITQNLGSPNTLVKNPNYGGLQGGLIPFTFADTTAANLTNLKYYAGAYIYTTSPRATWWRDAAVSTWVQVLPGGGSGSLGAWTTTLNTTIPTDLSLNGYFGTTAANGIGFWTNNTQRLILPATGLTFNQLVSDTTANKVMTYNPSTKAWGYGYWYGGGSGATPTWQQTLTAGSILNTNNTIDAGTNDLEFGNIGNFTIEAPIGNISIQNNNNSVALSVSNMTLRPYTGLLYIDTLTNLSTQDEILGRKNSTGQVGYITIGSGLSLSSGALSATGGANTALSNLASVAINTSLISDANNTDDLGSNTIGWRYGYISSGIGIGSGFTTPSAALDIRAADLFLTSSSVDQRFIIGESLVSATDVYAISWNRTDNQLVFNEGGAAVSMRLEGDANANLFFADATNDRIGIGDATPASLFTVGSGDLFQVNTSGDLVKLKNVTYSWPAANAAGALINDGSGNLSWSVPYWALTGTSTLTGNVTIDGTGGPYNVSIRSNSGGVLRVADNVTTIGDPDVAQTGALMKIDAVNNIAYILSSAIAGASVGDALTVGNTTTGEITVAPNLAFNLKKEGTMIYAKNGRVFAEDNSGNKTQLSPHDDKGNWIYHSTNKEGITTEINMIRLAELLEKVTGEKLIYKTKN